MLLLRLFNLTLTELSIVVMAYFLMAFLTCLFELTVVSSGKLLVSSPSREMMKETTKPEIIMMKIV